MTEVLRQSFSKLLGVQKTLEIKIVYKMKAKWIFLIHLTRAKTNEDHLSFPPTSHFKSYSSKERGPTRTTVS